MNRADQIFDLRLHKIQCKTDRVFAILLALQWIFAIVLAVTVSPRTWVNDQSYWHVHLWAALGIGSVLSLFPILCVITNPGSFSTRVVIAVAQAGYSTLLIHLTGGRIETHFHIFGSLAFLSFYRDWRVFIPATFVVAIDHLVRGVFWPESVFGVLSAAPWRAFEHAGWVLFEDVFLIWGCLTSVRELREMAETQAQLESSKQNIENEVLERTQELADSTSKLGAERRLLGAIMQSVTDGIIAADEDGNILCFNSGAEQILGQKALFDLSPYDWTQEYGLFELDGITPVAFDNVPLYQAIKGETVTDRELIVRRGVNEKVVAMNATPLISDSHRGGVVSFRDVTGQIKLQKQLSEAQKLESLGQLAAGIAHEINTPMQYVSDNLQFLGNCTNNLLEVVRILQENLDASNPAKSWQDRIDEVQEATDRCRFEFIQEQIPIAIDETQDGIKRVIEIVRAMKMLSHPGAQAKVSTNINEAIRSAVVITKNRWKYAAEIELELAEDLPDVKTLTAEINQVLLNLIVNAADAIVDRHGEDVSTGRIAIRTYGTEDHIAIEITDNGCGMTEEVRKKVFEPFFTTKEVGKGTGQGLAISFNVVVNHHGGRINVKSTPGEGTTFIVELPQYPPEQIQTDTPTDALDQPTQEIAFA